MSFVSFFIIIIVLRILSWSQNNTNIGVYARRSSAVALIMITILIVETFFYVW